MPGAWEIGRPEVLVAILTRETTSMAWAKSHRMMRLPPGSDITYLVGMPFDHARNAACEAMLKNGFQYLFFVDDDVQVPPDAYEILRSNRKGIVSGLYYRRNEPIAPVAIVDTPKGPHWLPRWETGQIIEVRYAGAGCMLIRRNVLETMPAPWFEWMCDRQDVPDADRTSEDFTFCRKAKDKYGFTTYLDTRVQCVHAGMSSVTTDGKMKPLKI